MKEERKEGSARAARAGCCRKNAGIAWREAETNFGIFVGYRDDSTKTKAHGGVSC